MSRRSRGEILAVLATGVLHLLFEELFRAKGIFIGAAASAWLAYALFRSRRDRAVWQAWGFRREGLSPAAIACLVLLVAGAAAMAAVAAARGSLRLHPHLLPLLAVYPAWGLTQHFLLQAMFARNVRDAGLRPAGTTALTAPLFGLVHWPDRLLMGATALLAFALTPLYLRWRNLWPLGIVHGWLGALAYFWLLERDPWAELFG
ncbi:MAG: CPBP family glutamic-type intramembrane protease [Planctomycetaceae bacterium]